MTIIHGHACDSCDTVDRTHPDDGTPAGWYLVARMTRTGGWDDAGERHFCSGVCLRRWVIGGGYEGAAA